jgi:3-methyladenine DNA glycosylase AlkD
VFHINAKQILDHLKKESTLRDIEGMKKFGISGKNVYGVSIPVLRDIAYTIGNKHKLALELWDTEVHEARILASMIDEIDYVTEAQMDKWVKDFDSWDVCDQVCMNLFYKTRFAPKKCKEWAKSDKEFVKRASFSLMAVTAVHIRELPDDFFIKLLFIIKKESIDERNFVKKAVNWALRQIGKRNVRLNKEAIRTAEEIQKIDSPSARWIAADALRELKSAEVQKRLALKRK